MVEVTGFEPAASSSRTKRSTKLSHTSILNFHIRLVDSFFIISTHKEFVNGVLEKNQNFLNVHIWLFCVHRDKLCGGWTGKTDRRSAGNRPIQLVVWERCRTKGKGVGIP